ncbi:MAG: multidrug effflux MFS transporter [Propionibacteriaceae bacterium]
MNSPVDAPVAPTPIDPTPRAVQPQVVEPAAPALGDSFVGRKYVQLVLVLGALSAIGPLTIDTYLPALPALTADLAATPAAAQLTISGLLAGLGLGQLVAGPLSDTFGRRRPLLVGLVGHGLMSILCALAPSVEVLTLTRVLQGLFAAAVAVTAMAVVRDLFSGNKAAQLLSRLILVLGVAPILAPSLGSGLLTLTSWRGIFVVLAVIAVLLVVLAVYALPETLPVQRRFAARPAQSLRAYGTLFRDGIFVTMVLVAGFMFAAMFAYVAGSPFILQGIYGLSPQQFGLAFGLNAVGLIASSQFNPVLVRRYGAPRVMTAAVTGGFASALVLATLALTGVGGILGFMIPLWFVIAACGLSFPNAPAIALNRHGDSAGTAAAMLGSAQFLIGGLSAPIVGALADGTAFPMAAVMVAATGISAALLWSKRQQLIDSVPPE